MFSTQVKKEGDDVHVEVVDLYSGDHHNLSLSSVGFITADKYAQSLTKHIEYVREAGEKIGVNREQLLTHDNSKWSGQEFMYYALNFHGKVSPVDRPNVSTGFAQAWLHHIHHNPHHWQHWIFPDGYSPIDSDVENGIVQMPDHYALEMIADWMGASMAYTGSWDMADWLSTNMPKIKLHSATAYYVRRQLDFLGYADTVHTTKWGHEL